MFCEKHLRKELKDLPKFIKAEIKKGNLDEAVCLNHTRQALEWLLEDNCECQSR